MVEDQLCPLEPNFDDCSSRLSRSVIKDLMQTMWTGFYLFSRQQLAVVLVLVLNVLFGINIHIIMRFVISCS